MTGDVVTSTNLAKYPELRPLWLSKDHEFVGEGEDDVVRQGLKALGISFSVKGKGVFREISKAYVGDGIEYDSRLIPFLREE